MRINVEFAEKRESEKYDFKPKFILISEGSETEPKYFEGLNKSVLTHNVEIINLLRDFSKNTNSHPKHIISVVREFFLNQDDKLKIREFKDRINNYLTINKMENEKENVNEKISKIYKDDNHIITFDDVLFHLLEIFKNTIYLDLISEFELYIFSQNISYSPDFDSVNIIVDRDKQNFKKFQFDNLVNECFENKIDLYISNPCFELWLLMHLDKFDEFSLNEIYENKKINNSTKFLEKCLKNLLANGYNKGKLKFEEFEPYIDKAIKKSKQFETDILKLENALGTNVGLLVEKLVDDILK